MTAAILGIVSAIVGLMVWLIKRRLEHEDAKTPEDRLQDAVERIDREIARSDGAGAAARLDEWLRKNKGGGDPG